MHSQTNENITEKLLNYFKNREENILTMIRTLVETESPSYDENGSHAVVSLLADEAQKIESVKSIERILVEGYGEHLIIHAFGEDKTNDAVMLLGHTDTVHPRGTLEARPYRMEKNRVYGPGIFDMKANCVLVLEVLRALTDLNLKPEREIIILLSCDEEVGSQTGRALVEKEAGRARACLVLEPSAPGGRVKTGRKGTGMFTMKTHGIPAHAGLDPEKGASAVLELAQQVKRLHEMTNFEIGTTVSVGVFHGGTTSNVVPENAYAEIDVRFKTMDEAARIEKEILSSKPFDERVKIEITGGINRPPLERDEKVVALYEKAKAVASSFGYELGETQVGGASDGNFVAALGVPVLDGLGVSGDGAHAVHEHIIADDIAPRAALIAGLILDI